MRMEKDPKLLLPNGGKKNGDFIPWDRICKKSPEKTDPSSLQSMSPADQLDLQRFVQSFSAFVSCTCHEPKQLICSKPQQKA